MNTYVITEMHDGNEIEVYETTCTRELRKFCNLYDAEDRMKLSPTVYRKDENGNLTTDF